ncbi:energy transducer TonB [Insolitispirillum peregrinum]|uniref:energy transducer TonB n=1 Tax=Insolitispirillum peregrinum TaxID=80876 RepID=UPI003617214E
MRLYLLAGSLSLLAHGGALALLLQLTTPPPLIPAAVPPVVMEVMLVSTAPASAPVPAAEPEPAVHPAAPAPPPPRPPRPMAKARPNPAPAVPSAAQAVATDSTPPETAPAPRSASISTPPGYSLGAVSTPHPPYPWSARQRNKEGKVVVRLFVDASGVPSQAEVIHSSGEDSLDTAALSTLRRWRLRPAHSDGVPVSGQIDVPILFRLL